MTLGHGTYVGEEETEDTKFIRKCGQSTFCLSLLHLLNDKVMDRSQEALEKLESVNCEDWGIMGRG